jgi:hypothetical protein
MIKRIEMEDCKPFITPIQTSCKLRKDDDLKSTDQRQYRSIIGCLLYVTTSRLDVMQVVGQVERFQAAPKESHVLAVKRIFRYLKGTEEFGLWYPKGKYLSIIAYTDADWEGCIDDQ